MIKFDFKFNLYFKIQNVDFDYLLLYVVLPEERF